MDNGIMDQLNNGTKNIVKMEQCNNGKMEQ